MEIICISCNTLFSWGGGWGGGGERGKKNTFIINLSYDESVQRALNKYLSGLFIKTYFVSTNYCPECHYEYP